MPCNRMRTHGDEAEMRAFIGCLIAMGVNRLPSLHDYWSEHDMLRNIFISRTFTRDRFLQILRYLHLSDNTAVAPGRLSKISSFMAHLNASFQQSWNLGREISIDESLVPTKGRSYLKQYIKNKPHKWGIKLWVLACSTTAYVWRFSVYSGREGDRPEHGLSYSVVIKLMAGLFHKWHCVFMDNFYSSVNLFVDLFTRGTYAIGTVRRNRKHLPPAIIDPITIKRMNRGQSIFRRAYFLLCSTWKDTREVTLLSTCSPATGDGTVVRNIVQQGQHTVLNVPVPPCVLQYNKYMGGVDLGDQFCTYYTVKRKTRKFWKVIFSRFLDIAIANAWIICRNTPGAPTPNQKQFRIQLAEALVGEFSGRKRPGPVPTDLRLQGKHFLVKGRSQRCALCSRRFRSEGLSRARDSSYWCRTCQPPVPLCVDPCHEIWHTSRNV